MNKFLNILPWLLLLTICLTPVVLLVTPLFFQISNPPAPLYTFIESHKKYYQSLFFINSVIVGSIGLLLGIYFYFNRLIFEKNASLKQIKKELLEKLIFSLKEYKELISSFFSPIENEITLSQNRTQKEHIFEEQQIYTEMLQAHNLIDDDIVEYLVDLHSKIDNNSFVMKKTLVEIDGALPEDLEKLDTSISTQFDKVIRDIIKTNTPLN